MLIIPIILTIAPVMVYQAIMLLGKKKSTSTHYVWTYIMMIYIWLVISVTGIGSIWDMISKGGLIAAFQQANISLIPFQSEGMFTYCMNVIMLMPLGFLLPYIWENFRNPLKVTLTGFLFSGFIEFAQLPTNRLVDIDDLRMNTLGAILGYVEPYKPPLSITPNKRAGISQKDIPAHCLPTLLFSSYHTSDSWFLKST